MQRWLVFYLLWRYLDPGTQGTTLLLFLKVESESQSGPSAARLSLPPTLSLCLFSPGAPKAWALGPTGARRASKGSRAGLAGAGRAPGHLLSLAAGTEDGAALASFPHSFSPLPFHLPLPGPPTPSWLSDPEVRPFLVARFPSPSQSGASPRT